MFNPLEQMHNRKGAYIVILALIFPACLLVMGVMVDIGLFYRSRAHLQSVADAAALAGAQNLPNCTTAANTARYYITTPRGGGGGPYHNYIDNATVAVNFSTDGQSFGPAGNRFCGVTLTAPAQSAIMHAVLGKTMDITVRAVARKASTGYAIFANEGTSADNQSALYFSTNTVKIFGNVHSNGKIAMQGIPTITNGTVTAVIPSNQATTTGKKMMPDSSKLKKPIKTNLVTLNKRVGTAAKPVNYLAESGNLIVQINTTEACYASFYAPEGNLSFQGNNLIMYGTAVADSIDFQLNSMEIHAPVNATDTEVKLVK